MNVRNVVLVFVAAVMMFAPGGVTQAADRDAYFWSQGRKVPVEPIPEEYLAIYGEGADKQTLSSDSAAPSGYVIEESPIRLPLSASFVRKSAHAADKSSSLARSGRAVRSLMPALRERSTGAYILPLDTVIARFKPDVSFKRAMELLQGAGLEDITESEYVSNQFEAQYPGGGMAVLDVANRLYESGEVVFCHPDMIMKKRSAFHPDDPYYTYQWHLDNLGQTGGTPGADINIEPAWDITRGSHTSIVGVSDDGIMWSHEDLIANYLGGYDFYYKDSDPSPSTLFYDPEYHGTATTGLMVAKGNNDIGVSGTCPDCGFYAAAFGTSVNDDANMFYWLESMGVKVSSNSWLYTTGVTPDVVVNAIAYVTTSGRNGLGMVVVTAAGNADGVIQSTEVAAQPNVLAVGASTAQDLRAYYSNWGDRLDIMAPSSGTAGSGITTTDVYPPSGAGYNSGGASGNLADGAYTNDFGGTSAATPIVAGVIGLMFDVFPDMKLEEAVRGVEFTADKIGALGYVNGRNDYYGYGRLNAYKAVLAASAAAYTGWWYNGDREGTGVSIECQGLRIFLTWYAYDQLGRPLWLSADGLLDDSLRFSGSLYRWTGWPLGAAYSPPSRQAVGTIQIDFQNASAAGLTFNVTIDGVPINGSFPIVKFLNEKVGGTRDARDISGWWFDPRYNGMGWYLEVRGGRLFLAWYNYRDDSSARWWSSGGPFDITQTVYSGELLEYAQGPCFGCLTQFQPTQTSLGTVSINFTSESQAVLFWNGATYQLSRFIFGNSQ